MHKIATAIRHVLHDKTEYRGPGTGHFTRRDPEHALRRITRQASALGLTVRFEPIGT